MDKKIVNRYEIEILKNLSPKIRCIHAHHLSQGSHGIF